MIQHTVPVLENVPMAERTFRLRLEDPQIGCRIRPGQFVMLRLPNRTNPLLARPFALYDTFLDEQGRPAGYDLVYLVVGKATAAMQQLTAKDRVEVWGPLGNGFTLAPTRHLVLVAGGIGQTPFPAVARAIQDQRIYGDVAVSRPKPGAGALATVHSPLTRRITLCYGVREARYLAGIDDFRDLGVEIAISTDDGSAGHRGFVTDLVQGTIESRDPPTRLMGCGPEPMMRVLAGMAARAAIPCELSLETPMACGIGACFSCVAQIRQDDGHCDYRRVCVEGPVFDATRVVF
jgi:dihydroorotate dehydrogenase electron transfer subunit